MKKLIKLVIVLVLLLAIAIVGVLFYIDNIAKAGVEGGATYALGVDTTLGKADVGVLGGTFTMKNMHVPNPSGFKSKQFMDLGEGHVSVSLGTLMEETVELPVLKLDGMELTVEKGADGKTNADVLLAHVGQITGGSTDEEGTPAEAKGGKKYVIKEVIITNVTLNVAMAPVGTVDKPLAVMVPEIRLTDVGSDSDQGVLLSELTGIIISATFKAVIANAGDVLPAAILSSLEGSVAMVGDLADAGVKVIGDVTKVTGEVGKQIGEIGEAIGGELGDTIKDAGKGVGDLGKGLGDIIPGKKDGEDSGDSKDDSDAEKKNPLDGVGKGLGNLLGGDKKDE